MTQSWDEVTEAVLAVVFAESWEESKRIVEERRGVLLTDAADEELAGLITSNRDEEETVDALEEHRALLTRCRREGIDAAFSSYLQPSTVVREAQAPDDEWNQTLDAAAEFVNARTWVASKLMVEQRWNLLLTDTADEVLSELIAQRRRDGDEDVRDLQGHRQLLALCRQKGIDTAFTEYTQQKEPFLKRAGEGLVAFVVVILILYVLSLLFT